LTTRDLLVCAVLGAVTALATIALSPFLAATAVISPPLYALLSGYSAIAPLLALRLTGTAGSATITAACCALIAWPFSPLGLLLLVAQVAPAVAMDLVFAARRYLGAAAPWLAAVAGAVVVFALSLPIISPDQFTPAVIVLTLVGRLVSYGLACAAATGIDRGLTRAGVQRRLSRP
jgi:hypothetical protein